MKFSAHREEFLKGLNIASRAVSANNTLPVLSNILLRSEGNKLYFESTNLEIAIRYFIQTEIINEGTITIPARLFLSYISLLKDDEINVHISERNTVNIDSKDSKTQIKGLPAEDFPQIPSVSRLFEISLDAKVLSEGISEVVFAAANTSARPILSGVFLNAQEKTLKMVSTDSYRLSEKKLNLEKAIEGEMQAIVPARTMLELSRLIGEVEAETVTLIVSDKQILFKIGNIELSSRLIDGQFPNYEQVIPKSESSTVFIEKSDLLQSIKRVSLFAKENNNNIKLEIKPSNQKLLITTEATQIGSEESAIDAKIEGAENKIALNSEYILDLLNALPSGEIKISVDNKLSPSLFRHKDIDDFIHIIMPLKI